MKKAMPLLIALSLTLVCSSRERVPKCFDPWISGMHGKLPKTITDRTRTKTLPWFQHPPFPYDHHNRYIPIYNRDRSEIILFVTCDWYQKDKGICQAELSNQYDQDPNGIILKNHRFSTGKGISLGMSIEKVKSILGGQCLTEGRTDGGLYLVYGLSVAKKPPGSSEDASCYGPNILSILKKNNMGNYFAAYYFEEGKLISLNIQYEQTQ